MRLTAGQPSLILISPPSFPAKVILKKVEQLPSLSFNFLLTLLLL
jgi:hypothetical protein